MPMYCNKDALFEARCIYEDNIDDIASWARGKAVEVSGYGHAILIANEIAFVGDYVSKNKYFGDEFYINIISSGKFVKENQEVIV